MMADPLAAYLKPQFSDQQCIDCSKALRTLQDLKPLYDLAEKCGVDCTMYKHVNGQLEGALSNIRHYFMSDER